jgi:hypothetical protein
MLDNNTANIPIGKLLFVINLDSNILLALIMISLI